MWLLKCHMWLLQDQGTLLHRIRLKPPTSAHLSRPWLTLGLWPLLTQGLGVWRCFIEKAKLLCFCLPKEDTTRNHVYITFIMGFMFMSRRSGRTRHHNMLRGVTFPSHAWGIRPITTHWISGQSQHTSLFRPMSFVRSDAFQKVGHRGETIMYSMWKIMCFFTLNRINTFHYTKYTK